MNTQKSFSVSKWVFLTSAGFIFGILLILLFGAFSEYAGIEVQFPLAISMGLGIGVMQWIVLRKHFDNSFKWIWLFIIGLSIPFLLFDILGSFLKLNEWYYFAGWGLGGFLSGYLQYRFYFLFRSAKAKSWVWYSFGAWVSCTLITSVIFIPFIKSLGRTLEVTINMIAILGCGPILGLITGFGMMTIIENKSTNDFRPKINQPLTKAK